MRAFIRRVFLTLLGLAVLAGAIGYKILFVPVQNETEPIVIIPHGSGIQKIARILEDAGAVPDAGQFVLAARLTGYDQSLKAGKYKLPQKASQMQILKILHAGRPYEDRVLIPEGLQAREIAAILARKVEIDSAAFMRLVMDSVFAHSLNVPANSLEGYLFPETYRLHWGISPESAIKIIVAEFFAQLPDSAEARARALGYSLHEMVTLASIIEGEAVVDSERAIISAVYHNRLRKGIRLQADPTIQYIIPDGPRRLLKRDLQIESRYNTYRYAGLPPGPINNPGRRSIEAALQPADVPYLYFVARGDGSHVFSVTLAQHNRAKRAFNRVRREVARKKKMQKEEPH